MWESILGSRCCGCRRPGPLLCGRCESTLRPCASEVLPPDIRLIGALPYDGAARSLILRLKVDGCVSASRPLARAMALAVWRQGLRATLVTWVPGRRREMRRRGFDHAEVLARGLSRYLGLSCRGLLERVDDRRDQVGLDAGLRRANVAGAFRGRAATGRVAVIDDLATTGATARACSAALVEAGVSAVEVVVAARRYLGHKAAARPPEPGH